MLLFYGIGNEYNITLKDAHGTLIRGEYIKVVLTQGDLYDVFTLQTGDDGVARLTINYLPGTYQITALVMQEIMFMVLQKVVELLWLIRF